MLRCLGGIGGSHGATDTAASIGCALLIASPSWAAMVEPGLGDLTINKGQGFKAVKSTITANVGDSVMVGPSGATTVVYDDGCKVSVQPGTVTTIAPLSPCASGSNAQVSDWWHWCEPATCVFWAIWGAGLGFTIDQIVQPSNHSASP
jgi:hypothetical protein